MSRFLLPWSDASIAIPRAWPPARVDCAMDALIAVRAHDRNGHLLHTIAAVIFVYAGALNQAPNGIATAGLLAMALARLLVFPALFAPLLRWPPLWLGLAWVAWSALSVTWSPAGPSALRWLASDRLLLTTLALWPVLDRARLLAWTLVLAATTNAVTQCMQSQGIVLSPRDGSWRAAGLAHVPAVAAIWSGGALLMIMGLWCDAGKITRAVLGVMAMLCAAGVMLAASRGPALMLVPAIIVAVAMLLMRGLLSRRTLMTACIALLLPTALALYFVGGPFWRYLMGALHSPDQPAALSVGIRWFWWQIALEQWAAHPWFGGGLGSFAPFLAAHDATREYAAQTHIPLAHLHHVHPHNTYIRALTESGLVGLLLVLGLVASLLREGWRRSRTDPVATAAFAGMLYVFLATNTECVELMNVALTHVVILAALCALPRATGYSDMCSTTTRV